jgi:hypothetical protein
LAGTERAKVAIVDGLTLAELLAVLVNLYPGLGRPDGPYRTGRLSVTVNHGPAMAQTRVSDADCVVLGSPAPVIDLASRRGGIG